MRKVLILIILSASIGIIPIYAQSSIVDLSVENINRLSSISERLLEKPESKQLQDSILLVFNTINDLLINNSLIIDGSDVKKSFTDLAIDKVLGIIANDSIDYSIRKQLSAGALELLKEFAFAKKSGDSENRLFGLLFGYRIRLLTTFNEEEQALQEVKQLINEYEGSAVANFNRFDVYCAATRFFTYSEDLDGNKKPQAEDIQKSRLPLYDTLFILIEQLFGKNSSEWLENAIKKANYYLICEDMKMAHRIIEENIAQIEPSKIDLQEAIKICQVIDDSQDTFEYSNSVDAVVALVESIVQNCKIRLEDSTIPFEVLAELKDNSLIGDFIGASEIYKSLANHYDAKGDIDRSLFYDYRNSKALFMASLYNECLALTTTIEDRFLHTALEMPESLKYWYLYSVAGTISHCYRMLDCPDESAVYQRKASSYLLSRIELGEYASPEEYISDMRSLADSYLSGPDYESRKSLNTIIELNKYIESSTLSDEDKKAQLMESYGVMANYYTALYDLPSAITAIKNYLKNGGDYLNSLRYFANAYKNVAIEPEISLEYYEKYIDGLFERVENPSQAYALTVDKDAIRHYLRTVHETYNDLGNNKQAVSFINKELQFTSRWYGEDSDEYSYAYMDYLSFKESTTNDKNKLLSLVDSIIAYSNKYNRQADYFHFIEYCYFKAGDKDKAKFYAEKRLNTIKDKEEFLREEGHIYELYYSDEDYEKLLNDRIIKWKNNGDDFHYFKSVCDLASHYNFTQQHNKALTLWKLLIDNCHLKELQDEVNSAYMQMFESASALDSLETVSSYFENSSVITRAFISSSISDYHKSEKDREKIISDYSNVPFSIGEQYLHNQQPGINTGTVYDNILFRKNALLSLSISSINLIRSSGDTLLVKKYNRMQALKSGLANNRNAVIFDGYTHKDISREQAEKLVIRFDEEISQRSSMLGDITSDLDFSWNKIQERLSKDDIAIEFSRYENSGKLHYAALLLQSKGLPIFVPLVEEDSLIKVVKSNTYFQDATLYDLIWKPISPYIKDKRNIYFAPDGLLYNIAIESLPGLDYKSNLYRLSSTQKILDGKFVDSNQAKVYGGIQYDVDINEMAMNKTIDGYTRDISADIFLNESGEVRSGAKFLYGSKVEAENITNQFADNRIQCQMYSGVEATESSFKSLSGQSMKILHIATHGFYAKPLYDSSKSYDTHENEALYRSGLLFAGANNYLKGRTIPYNVEDGVLTSKEISELDFRNVDLAVLSACETGLGDITSNGVYGLQRGFKKAGTKSLLVSLWPVDDNATQMFMTQFYKNLISGKSKNKSLADAQQYLKDYTVSETFSEDSSNGFKLVQQQDTTINEVIKTVHPYENPYYWAAFILIDGI